VTLEDLAGASTLYLGLQPVGRRFPQGFHRRCPARIREIKDAPATISRKVIIGGGRLLLPGVRVGEGEAVGAMSLVTRSLEPRGIYGGHPARPIRPRSKSLLGVEKAYRAKESTGR
jgi:galactoside O-acetyltransferase